ncbi:MAG: TetR/AcrR family transcriptional regulator [Solirubrobacteraceae bacterium]
MAVTTSDPRATETTATRGRPRDPACDVAILQATIELIAEVGYDRASLDAVAQRAGVSKPTIYRRWPEGKEQVVAAAVAQCHQDVAAEIDTGSLRGDLVASVERFITGMGQNAHLAAGLTQRLRESPQLAEVFREQLVPAKRQYFETIVRRAVERGELPGVPRSAALIGDVVPAVIHSRALITGDALDAGFVTQLVDHVLLPALRAGAEKGRGKR